MDTHSVSHSITAAQKPASQDCLSEWLPCMQAPKNHCVLVDKHLIRNLIACPVYLFCFIHTSGDTESRVMMSAGDCHGIEGASPRAAGRLAHCLTSRTQSSCCLHSRRPGPGATSCTIMPVLISLSFLVLPLHSSCCLHVISLSCYM